MLASLSAAECERILFSPPLSCALSAVWVAASVCPVCSPSFLLVQCEEDEKFSVVSSCEAGDPES